MEAVVVKTPQIEPLIESDRGKFTALLENVQRKTNNRASIIGLATQLL